MNIAFDGRPLVDGEYRGLSRYTIELIKALQNKYNNAVNIFVYSPVPIDPSFRKFIEIKEVVFQANREILWEQVELPKQLSRYGVDVFHSTGNRGLPAWRVCKYVLTLHDMIETMPKFVERGPLKSYLRRKYADYISVNAANKIVTVSEHSKKDIIKYWNIPNEKVVVIYEAASDVYFNPVHRNEIASVSNKYGLPSEYVLYLGGFDKKKNVNALVSAYRLLTSEVPRLVLAGERKWDFGCIKNIIEEYGLSERIITPGRIDDEDLPALYQGALAFIYPSLYEGFGLQLLEAMASGIPVLASDRTCFPEVLNGAGLLFDPGKSENIAENILAVCNDRDLRNELSNRSKERAKDFSWEKTAIETMSVYNNVVNIRKTCN